MRPASTRCQQANNPHRTRQSFKKWITPAVAATTCPHADFAARTDRRQDIKADGIGAIAGKKGENGANGRHAGNGAIDTTAATGMIVAAGKESRIIAGEEEALRSTGGFFIAVKRRDGWDREASSRARWWREIILFWHD